MDADDNVGELANADMPPLTGTSDAHQTVAGMEAEVATDQTIVQAAEPSIAPKNRRGKATTPTNVDQVRRSSRIARLAAGFKDKPPSDVITEEDGEPVRNLAPEFEASVVDTSAPEPPHLPVPTLQAIGIGQCQIASTMLTEEELNYDSTNDSIESN